MPASDISASQRFSLTLDSGLVLERMILSRLSELKRKRGQDWLRSLLVQGFLVEGQWLRRERQRGGDSAAPAEATIPTTPFANWLAHAGVPTRCASDPVPGSVRHTVTAIEPPAGSKPFAHLRNVIG